MMHPEAVSFDHRLDRSLMKTTIIKVERGGAVVTYLAILGMFKMEVVVLHVSYRTRNKSRAVLKIGAFGDVIQLTGTESAKVAKRIKFWGARGNFKRGSTP